MQTVNERYKALIADTSLDVWEYLAYFRAVAKGNVLEIGTRWGASTTAFLDGVQENGGHVYSVDINRDCAHLFPTHPQWTFIHANSYRQSGRILHTLQYKPLDVLFVDGDHSYEAALYDMQTYGMLVKAGGLILCHDVFPEGITDDLKAKGWQPSPGARDAYYAFLNCHPRYRAEIIPGRAGLGVIHVS